MKEVLHVRTTTQKRCVDLLATEGRRQRQIPTCDSLREAQKVWRYAFLLAGEDRSCPSKTRRHLVDDQVDVVRATEPLRFAKEATRMDEHSRGSLHERLDDERGNLGCSTGEL